MNSLSCVRICPPRDFCHILISRKTKLEASLSSVIHIFCLPGGWNHRTHAEVGQRLTFDLPVRTVYDSVLRITSITGLMIKPEDCVPGAAACEEKLQSSSLHQSSNGGEA